MDFLARVQRYRSSLASVRGIRDRVVGINIQVFVRGPRSLTNVRYKAATRYSGTIELRRSRYDDANSYEDRE